MNKHAGKNWRDFNAVGDHYADLYSFGVGSFFMEDTYPEVYEVLEIQRRDVATVVKTLNLTTGEETDWFYTQSAYAPTLVKLEPK